MWMKNLGKTTVLRDWLWQLSLTHSGCLWYLFQESPWKVRSRYAKIIIRPSVCVRSRLCECIFLEELRATAWALAHVCISVCIWSLSVCVGLCVGLLSLCFFHGQIWKESLMCQEDLQLQHFITFLLQVHIQITSHCESNGPEHNLRYTSPLP